MATATNGAANGSPKSGPVGDYLTEKRTRNYRPQSMTMGYGGGMTNHRRFSLFEIEQMLCDDAVQIGLEFKTAPIYAAKLNIDVKGGNGNASDYIAKTVKSFWERDLHIALGCVPFGFSGAEAQYKDDQGTLRFDGLHALYQRDVRPYTQNGELAYVKVLMSNTGMQFSDGSADDQVSGKGAVFLPASTRPDLPTKGYWSVYRENKNRWYGVPAVQPCWCFWRQKTMPNGAIESAGKAFYKHGYTGMICRHPDEVMADVPGEKPVHSSDFMLGLANTLIAGGNVTMSSEKDASNNFKYLIEKYGGEAVNDFTNLLNFPDWLDRHIHQGLLIPPEILSHDGNTGGYSRSNISWMAFLILCQQMLNYHLTLFVDTVLRPLVLLNYGDVQFEVTAEKLLKDEPEPGAQGAVLGAPNPEQPKDGAPAVSNDELLFSQRGQWEPYTGPNGGKGWKHSSTGEIRYQQEKPDESEADHGEKTDYPGSEQQQKAMKSLATIGRATMDLAKGKQSIGGNAWHAAISIAGAAGHVEHAVVERIAANVARLPAAVRLPTVGVVKLSFATYIVGQKMAKAVARERGGDEHAERVGRIIMLCDMAGAKVVPAATASVGGAIAGVLYFAPIGSLGYLAYSTARDPLATLRTARKAVQSLGKGKSAPVMLSLVSDQVPAIFAAIETAGDRADLYEAILLAAMDETRDMADAMDLAQAAFRAEPIQMSMDASGHEHKGKGEGGGQFTGSGNGAEGKKAAPVESADVDFGDLAFINYNDMSQESHPLNAAAYAAEDALSTDWFDDPSNTAKRAQSCIETSLARNREALKHVPKDKAGFLDSWMTRHAKILQKPAADLSAKAQAYREAEQAMTDHEALEPPDHPPDVDHPVTRPEPDQEDFASEQEYEADMDKWEAEQQALVDQTQNAHDKLIEEWKETHEKLEDKVSKLESKAQDARERFTDKLGDFNVTFADKVMDIASPETAPKPVQMSQGDNPWQRYKGPRGGDGWKHSGAGDIRYQPDQPGAHETGAGESKRPESDLIKPPAKRGKMTSARRIGKGKDAAVILADGKAAPEHIKPSMVPPDWTDVTVSLDPSADVLVQGRDKAGRSKTVYADSFHARNAAVKFARTQEMLKKSKALHDQNQDNRKNPELREHADCTWLMMEQATRPGSDSDTKAKVKAFGATTLLAQHVVEALDGVRLQFIGKEGVHHNHLIRNPDLAEMLLQRKKTADQRNGKLFDTDYERVREYAHRLDGGRFSPKDFRTKRANELAIAEISKIPDSPTTLKEYKARVKAVAEKVCHVLGNKWQQCLESYIDPVLFSGWKVAG